LAESIERLIEQKELMAPLAKLRRTSLRSIARRSRREAWQHLTVALSARRLLERMNET
jgi:hypothetical protein